MSATIETFDFQAESKQLLDLMIHSIYSNKDIFLRELISNASDALDRLRFEAVKHPEFLTSESDLHIRIDRDTEARTLTISDNGIGMGRDEVIELIGTIAKSGTKQFIGALKEAKDGEVGPELIGQFGVGFYSSFMAADRVTLETRKAGEDQGVRWESEGAGTYTLEDVERPHSGTSITLHLKPADEEDAQKDYTQEWTIRDIVKRYSDFVAYPIQMEIERTEVERNEDGSPKEDAEEKTVVSLETLNSMKAIWLRPKDEVSDEELQEFYKHVSHDWNEPMETIRAKIEGTLEYQLLLFIPSQAPFDLYMREARRGVQLYVKRVFIMDDCTDLLPEYLRFVRGVVDSEDLSLNISREILQQDRQIQRMRKGIVGKVLDSLKLLAKRDEQYEKFWGEFGAVLKEGIYREQESKDALLDLMRAESTNDPKEKTSLQAYIDRMPEDQEGIYFMTGESRRAIEGSPHLEAFKDKGYEVLILTDPVDELWTQSVTEYQNKKLQSIGKGDVDLGSAEEKEKAEEERKEAEQSHASLLECIQSKLDEFVKEVRLSNRLTTSAACLVTGDSDLTPQLEALMRASNQEVPDSKRILELNPKHAILEKLQGIFDADGEDARLGDYAELLYGQAALAEGQQPKDPGKFSRLVADLMVQAI
jgi:molecular chaperone HtpG